MDAVSRRAPLRREADPQVDRGALIDLRHVGAILRRRWMILCAAMVDAIVVAAAAYLVAEPRYLATAPVEPERTAAHYGRAQRRDRGGRSALISVVPRSIQK